MKKQLIAVGAACAATFAIFAASDRIDIFDKAGSFVSLIVDDIQEITLGKAADGEGYTTINVATTTGTKQRAIADMGDVNYVPVDYDKPHAITTADAPNARVRLLDCRNNTDVMGTPQIDPTKPADWRGCEPDLNPHFLIDTDKGYASEFAITGVYSGKVYTDNPNFIFWSTKDVNLLGIDSYSFDMPFEPIEISATSVELDTYKDAAFLGEYKGYLLRAGDNRISHKPDPVLSATFNGNTTYVMKSTDDHQFDIIDIYTWDEASNTFSYIPYAGEMVNEIDLEIKTGVVGKFHNDGFLFATFRDLLNDKPDNNVRYFAAKSDIEFTVTAADIYDHHLLVQAKPADGGATRYFYYGNSDRYPAEVTMEFTYGSNIGADCTAWCSDANGDRIFKYDYKGAGYEPTYTFRGAEYGDYNGEAETLRLDGFGKCTLGDTAGTYTIDGGMASVTIGSETTIYVVDRDARTYTVMESDPWDGPAYFELTTATGSYRGGEETSSHSMRVDLDKDFAGNDAPGTAAVRFKVTRDDGFSASSDAIASTGSYLYNAASQTLVITNLYMGTSATTSTRRNMVLKLSADKQSAWVDDTNEDRVYGTGRDGSYLRTGTVNTMLAPVAEADPVELAAKYTGAPTLSFMGQDLDLDSSISFDAATGKARLYVFLGGDYQMALYDGDYDYTVNGNVVTIKGVEITEQNGNMQTASTVDLVFTVAEDGTMTTTQNLARDFGTGEPLEVTFAGVTFAPAAEEETTSLELADAYTATYNLAMNGQPWEDAVATITFDTDARTANIKVVSENDVTRGDLTVSYEIDGNLIIFKDVPTYKLVWGSISTSSTDLTFELGEDGNLYCDQSLYFKTGNNLLLLTFSDTPLSPEGAEEETPAVELASAYNGSYTLTYNGSAFKDADVTITFDKATSTATIDVVVESTALASVSGAFSVEGNTVTIADVDNYELVYFMPTAGKIDLVFEIGEDGTLTSDQTLGISAMGAVLELNFADAALTPVGGAEPPAVELAASYTGTYTLLYYGSAFKEADATITFDSASATATINVVSGTSAIGTVSGTYTVEGNTVTIANVDNYELVNFMPTAGKTDLTFEIGEDGNLTSSNTLGLSAMGAVLELNFADAALTPVAE